MRYLKVILLLSFVFLIGCVKGIDMDQLDDVEILTDHNISLIHFDLESSNFLDNLNNEVLVLTDTTLLPIFIGPYTQDYLIQADFEYILSNSFDRDITLQYKLLDIDNNLLYQFTPMQVPQGSSDLALTQIIVENDIPAVLLTDKIVVTVRLDSGSIPLDPIQQYIFNLKSALILHYKITVNNE